MENLFPILECDEISLLQRLVTESNGVSRYPASSIHATRWCRMVEEIPAVIDITHRSQLLHVAGSILAEELRPLSRQRTGKVGMEAHLIDVFKSLSTEELINTPIPELARMFGCSHRHLNRLFNQHFNVSTTALRKELRLLKSTSLLRDKESKIIHVAEECGFSHLGSFNTSFKQRFGVSPGIWRKNLDLQQPLIIDPAAASDSCLFQSTGLCPLITPDGMHSSAAPSNSTNGKNRARAEHSPNHITDRSHPP